MLLEKKYLDKADISNLPAEKQQEILKIKETIQLDHESISCYSQEVTKKLTDFSSKILDSVKIKDSPEVENMLVELMGELNTLDSETLIEKKPSFFRKLIKTNELKNFIMKYESVSSVINDVKNKLMQAEYQLRKDIKVNEKYLENNKDYIEELDKYIVAAKMKVNEEDEEIQEEKTNMDSSDLLRAQELAIKEAEINTLKRKIHNMELQRAIAIQNIPQLMLLKDGNSVLIDKINDSINSAIPLWESQIVISIHALRQQSGVKIQKGVTDTTNRLLEQNSEVLKQSAIGVATELERDIVDIETLKKSNENLINTLKEIKSIREEGSKKREQTVNELQGLQMQLNQALIETKM